MHERQSRGQTHGSPVSARWLLLQKTRSGGKYTVVVDEEELVDVDVEVLVELDVLELLLLLELVLVLVLELELVLELVLVLVLELVLVLVLVLVVMGAQTPPRPPVPATSMNPSSQL